MNTPATRQTHPLAILRYAGISRANFRAMDKARRAFAWTLAVMNWELSRL